MLAMMTWFNQGVGVAGVSRNRLKYILLKEIIYSLLKLMNNHQSKV